MLDAKKVNTLLKFQRQVVTALKSQMVTLKKDALLLAAAAAEKQHVPDLPRLHLVDEILTRSCQDLVKILVDSFRILWISRNVHSRFAKKKKYIGCSRYAKT